MSSTADQRQSRARPAVLSYGFRPFFFLAALWAGGAMLYWIAYLAGHAGLPSRFDPASWHAHEMLFGYLGAVIAGFLLTAMPNWTGRPPIAGWPLAGLVALWIAGRVAVAISGHLPWLAVLVVDLSCLVWLAAIALREILAGRNWRNLPVLALLVLFVLGNGIFHWEGARGAHAASGAGLRIGLAAGVLMIALIGGRIIPAFTRNWLIKRGSPTLPAPFGRFDLAVIVLTVAALGIWIAAPLWPGTGAALIVMGVLHLARLGRWAGARAAADALVWILHIGYAFVPLGALALGAAILAPGSIGMAAAQHLWMAGAFGVMTLAVMSRATLGHTGRALTAGAGTTALYLCVIASVLLRFAAGLAPGFAMPLYSLSGAFWTLAFLGFAALYGPALLRARQGG